MARLSLEEIQQRIANCPIKPGATYSYTKTGALYGILGVSFGAGSLAGDELVITYSPLGDERLAVWFSKLQQEFETEFKREGE